MQPNLNKHDGASLAKPEFNALRYCSIALMALCILFNLWCGYLVVSYSSGCSVFGLWSLNGGWLLTSLSLPIWGVTRILHAREFKTKSTAAILVIAISLTVLNGYFLSLWLSAGRMPWLCIHHNIV